jgi:hypothetical protein
MITSKIHSPSTTRKMWTTTATDLKTGVETSQLKVTSTLETNIMMEQTWIVTKKLWHKVVNKSSHTISKIQDRGIIIHAKRSSEHKSNFSFQVSIGRVYENAHIEVKMSQYIELNTMNKHMLNHPYLNHSKQKTEIIKAHVLHTESSFLHMTREREREMSKSWIPKG